MQRAHRPEQKEIRRQAILAGAARLFGCCRYQDLRMADLAVQLGLGKGTLYLYFPTKEALFLAVLQGEMEAWFAGAAAFLETVPAGSAPAPVAAGLVRELLARPLLPPLQAAVHGVLEGEVPGDAALAFARFLHEGMTRLGASLEAALPGLGPGRGAEFLLRFYGLVIGTRLMSSRPPAVRELLRGAGLQAFDFTFEEVFGATVADLLHGMLR